MPKLEYFIVAESHAVDSETKRVSLFNILEHVRISGAPFIPEVVAVASWIKEAGDENVDHQATLLLHRGGGEPEAFPINFTMTDRRLRTAVRLQNLPATAPTIRFEILLDGTHRGEHVIDVALITNAPPSGTTH